MQNSTHDNNTSSKFSNIKALIFDYGGTLDTAGRHWSHVVREGYGFAGVTITDEQWREAYVFGERALAKEYIVVPEDNFHDVLVKKIEKEFLCLTENNYLPELSIPQHEAVQKIADYCYAYALRHVEASRKVLNSLAERYPMVLVSNFYGNIHSVLGDFKLNCFKAVIESSVVGVRKPDPAIFRLGVETLGCDARNVLVVGDSYDKDILPASSLGCSTVWVKGEGWGSEPDDTSAAGAVVSDVSQLLTLLP